MIILKTKRLILRTWKEHDLDSMSIINQDPLVCEFLPKIGDRAATQIFINQKTRPIIISVYNKKFNNEIQNLF